MTTFISVQVPEGDALDLEDLAQQLGVSQTEPVLTHPFDGETLLQMLLPVGIAAIPVIKAWINARVERGKQYRIVCRGIELTGYDSNEAVEILERVLSDEEDDDDGDD